MKTRSLPTSGVCLGVAASLLALSPVAAHADTSGPGSVHYQLALHTATANQKPAGKTNQATVGGHSSKATKGQNSRGQNNKGKGDKPTKPTQRYHVATGPTFTSPTDGTAGLIRDKVLRAINHTARGAKIRLVSWNFDSFRYVGALTAAHKRGVSVRIIMSRQLADLQGPKGPYHALQRNLAGYGNAQRPQSKRSWFRTCDHSCRGKGGSMHAKYFIFSQSGASKEVVINTSANLTGASANIQWNEAYTTVGDSVVYDNYMHVFNQASRDQVAAPVLFKDGKLTGWFYPRPGRSDLVMDLLNPVVCRNAGPGSGVGGKTAIRVAQDVFNNKRGLAIAKKLLALYRHGCSVKVVYSQAVGDDIKKVIKSMPNNHLVQDRNGDGAYDRYLHAKLMTISGHWGNDTTKHIVMDGSANWSATALQSDEQGMIFYDRASLERRYAKFINHMFSIHLVSAPYTGDPTVEGRRTVTSPVGRFHGMEG